MDSLIPAARTCVSIVMSNGVMLSVRASAESVATYVH